MWPPRSCYQRLRLPSPCELWWTWSHCTASGDTRLRHTTYMKPAIRWKQTSILEERRLSSCASAQVNGSEDKLGLTLDSPKSLLIAAAIAAFGLPGPKCLLGPLWHRELRSSSRFPSFLTYTHVLCSLQANRYRCSQASLFPVQMILGCWKTKENSGAGTESIR